MKHDPIRPSSWLHPLDCPCSTCNRGPAAEPRPLGLADFAWHAAAGIVAGNVLAFLYDPRGSAEIVVSMIRWAL